MITFIAGILMLQIVLIGIDDYNDNNERAKIDREVKKHREYERHQEYLRRMRRLQRDK